MNILEIKNLSKAFEGFSLKNVNLSLPKGCIMGLIGENGAGKSTIMRLILNMIPYDSGSITVFGRRNYDNELIIKEETGVVLGAPSIPDCFTADMFGRVMSNIFSRWDSGAFYRNLDRLSVPRKKSYKDMSQGMKMKLGIAAALSHNSRLLLLDEAMNGLDPVARDEALDMLNDYTRSEDNSILISSHIVSDLEKICDYVTFIKKGEIILSDEKDELIRKYGMLRCSREHLEALKDSNMPYIRLTPYGAEALVKRNDFGEAVSPVNLEELFIFMMKGEM